ncbi:hypothetical protein HK097_009814 [Rhizophlyctis rosea]|uniref:NAD(P)-binding protein n=1 Tax=Rhizophlyctis rosea TaxID=64517 RepID=A0AAD5SAL2_9FUNG|nr:hypothetical protein HK097_009814 [Rhizophlyctis rosea]
MEFLRTQLSPLPTLKPYEVSTKTIVVTGANVGLGFEAAAHFARLGPKKLIVTTRDAAKGQDTVNRLVEATGIARDNIEYRELELSSFESVTKFAREYEKSGLSLDVLVESAGVAPDNYRPTGDGFDLTVQVNVLSTFLLFFHLLPVLRKTASQSPSPSPRAIIISSEVHYWVANPTASQLSISAFTKDPMETNRYATSKLLEVLLVRHIAGLLATSKNPLDKRIITHTVNPGLCHSELMRENDGWAVYLLKKAIARTGEQGARNYVWAALDEEAGRGERNGGYVSNMAFGRESEFVRSPAGKAMEPVVWNEIVRVLEEKTGPLDAIKDWN